ncbi:hypothetical protein FI667_g10154, partial [Globisporangium splendens]
MARFRRRTRALALLICVYTTACNATRSCTNEGQVQVPCEDQLELEGTEKFLITLFGHSCYDVQLLSHEPLDVYFYEAHGSFYAWRLRELDTELGPRPSVQSDSAANAAVDLPIAEANDNLTTANATSATAAASLTSQAKNAHLCDKSQECRRTLYGLARHGVYNLVVAYSNATTAELSMNRRKYGNNGILLSLGNCDASSFSHILGLVFVACMGFLSVILCLCLMGEYVLGLRSMTKLRKTLKRHHQFVELTQVESTKDDVDGASVGSPVVPLLAEEEPSTPANSKSKNDSDATNHSNMA